MDRREAALQEEAAQREAALLEEAARREAALREQAAQHQAALQGEAARCETRSDESAGGAHERPVLLQEEQPQEQGSRVVLSQEEQPQAPAPAETWLQSAGRAHERAVLLQEERAEGGNPSWRLNSANLQRLDRRVLDAPAAAPAAPPEMEAAAPGEGLRDAD